MTALTSVSSVPAAVSVALETVNGFRSLHKLEPVSLDGRLCAAAGDLVASMAKTRQLAHKDRAGTRNALERAQAHGFDGPIAEMVSSGFDSLPSSVVGIFDGPYHRRLFLRPGQFVFGCAEQGGYAALEFGGPTGEGVVLSPPDGARGIPTKWDGFEEPTPVPDLKGPFGYPILLAAYGSGNLTVGSAQLVSESGAQVPVVVRDPSNDKHATGAIIIVPKSPLQPGASYTVHASFVLDGTRETRVWSFRTSQSR
ncbi:MAG: hypothetical protein JSS66_11605 [Armatimonadetes bacterium]|nr:hypothetical protein [Armatimonadota bacterium]